MFRNCRQLPVANQESRAIPSESEPWTTGLFLLDLPKNHHHHRTCINFLSALSPEDQEARRKDTRAFTTSPHNSALYQFPSAPSNQSAINSCFFYDIGRNHHPHHASTPSLLRLDIPPSGTLPQTNSRHLYNLTTIIMDAKVSRLNSVVTPCTPPSRDCQFLFARTTTTRALPTYPINTTTTTTSRLLFQSFNATFESKMGRS